MSAHSNPPSASRRRAAVMADVAKLAGVSHQTVSRVINNSDQVRAETRDRVLAAMRMLNYRPNTVARALVTGRTRTLGVVSFDTTLYGPASTLFAIERAAHDANYFVSVVSLHVLDRPSLQTAVERLAAQGVEGILVISPLTTATAALTYLPNDVPIVAVVAGPDDAVPVISVDQFAGGVAATRHLISLGHQTIRHIAGPGDFIEAQQRTAGWQSELRAAGLPVPSHMSGDWSARSGYELARHVVEDSNATAVFVANDQMALGLLRYADEHGVRVPADLSVVGFDDIPESPYFTPPLTTVRQDFLEMGRRSLRLLLNQLGSGDEPPSRRIAPELVVRSSTAAR